MADRHTRRVASMKIGQTNPALPGEKTEATTTPLDIELAGETVTLWPEGAVFWRGGDHAVLFIADIHLGKGSAMLAGGVPVATQLCEAIAERDLHRITRLVERTGARSVVFLGDLLHAREGRRPGVMSLVAAWRREGVIAGVDLMLVRGNHDTRAGDPPEEWGVRCVDEPTVLGPWELRHYPRPPTRPTGESFWLAGHVHPVFTIKAGTVSERAPCFHLRRGGLILPAWGSFTGGAGVRLGPGERAYVCGPRRVLLGGEGR